jgi:hypothetical protein
MATEEKVLRYRAKLELEAKAKAKLRRKQYCADNKEKLRKKAREYRRQSLVARYGMMRGRAKRASLLLTLTFDQYKVIVKDQKCFFCTGPLPFEGHGVDRLDNRLGYVFGNCIPCCGPCNMIKGHIEGAGFIYPRTLELMQEVMKVRAENKEIAPIPLPGVIALKIQQVA